MNITANRLNTKQKSDQQKLCFLKLDGHFCTILSHVKCFWIFKGMPESINQEYQKRKRPLSYRAAERFCRKTLPIDVCIVQLLTSFSISHYTLLGWLSLPAVVISKQWSILLGLVEEIGQRRKMRKGKKGGVLKKRTSEETEEIMMGGGGVMKVEEIGGGGCGRGTWGIHHILPSCTFLTLVSFLSFTPNYISPLFFCLTHWDFQPDLLWLNGSSDAKW